jgi:L-ascorbate metabolism protein UlaG (beta-lactamase superfamily)
MVTMDGEQGVEAVKTINPETAIPIHYNDYDVFKSPLEDFKAEAEKAGLTEKIVYLSHGESYNFQARANKYSEKSG